MIRKFIICLFSFQLAVWCAVGQQNYKTLYESLKNKKDYEAFQALFAYQSATTSKDFVNVNGYYQMGLIAQKMMRQYDPFLQSQNTAQCIADAKTYLSLALYYFTEKEAKSNGHYYQASGEITYAGIKKDIENRLNDVKKYDNYFEQNLLYLNKCTRIYNTCIEIFGNINRQNSRLNDLYFLVDNALKQNLASLQTNFDSTLYYVNKLKESLESYPMSDYKIDYSLAPVTVYRLHGLVAANFTTKKLKIWDFRSWVDSFRKVLDSDVAFLYKQADEIHKVNLDYIAKLKRSSQSGIPASYIVNPLVINKIDKYDFNSIVAPLLKYQENKIKFLFHNVNNVVDNSLYTTNNFAKSNNYYFDLISKKQIADSSLRSVESKVTPAAIKKYDTFFAANYKGQDALKTYLQNEAKNNDAILHNALDAYKNNVWQSFIPGEATTIQYKNEPLFTGVITPNYTGKKGYFIHSKAVLPSKKVFVTGSYVNPQSDVIAFVALLNNNTIEWLKTLDKKDGKNHGVLVAAVDNGFAVVTTAENEKDTINYMYLLDNGGTVKKNVKLAVASIPRKLLYDDIGETFLLACKGKSFATFAISNDPLQMCLLKADLSVAWQRELPFWGYLVNVIKTNDRFYVYGAYNKITDAAGKTTIAGEEKINAFAYPINTAGNWLALQTFNAPFSYYPLLVSKISNEYVDMITVKASADGSMEDTNKSYYMIISSENKIYYQF